MMSFREKKVLVTGGAGFIGSHLVDELLQRNAEVRVVDDLSRGHLDNVQNCADRIEFILGDLANKEIAEKATKDIDICFHLAAIVGGVEYMASHSAEMCKNMLINYNVIDACRKMDVERLLYTSTACTYPVDLQIDANQPPLKEEDVVKYGARPDSEYGWVKLLGEIQCQAYQRSYGMKIAIVRPFNPYGPRESFDPHDSHVIPALIRKAVFQENPFIVWGDGGQTRVFTYVEDLVKGMILAVEKATDANPLNLGGYDYVSIRELAELILTLTNYDTSIVWDTTKPEGVRARKADMSKVHEVIGWRPKVTLEQGLRKTIDWFARSPNAKQVALKTQNAIQYIAASRAQETFPRKIYDNLLSKMRFLA